MPTEAEPPGLPRRRRRNWWKVLAVIGVAVLLAVLGGTKGFGLRDGIPGYQATYRDEEWGFTLSPPRPYVVKRDTETFTQRVLLVFDPAVWDGDYPEWSAMMISSDRPDDYVQPTLADITDAGEQWAEDFVKDHNDELGTDEVKVQESRALLVGGAPAWEVQIWYQADYDIGVWED